MSIGIILGTRPEIIKMSPIIRECQKRGISFFILHTGQHYSKGMDDIFFQELSLPQPDYNLKLGGLPYRKQVGLFSKHISRVLKREMPRVVIVQGDTITVITGTQSANKLGIPVAHLEAGLRSHDITMMEEVNRILTDHNSEFLFAPTALAVKHLLTEGCAKKKIFLTGNTIVDAMRAHTAHIARSTVLTRETLRSKKFFLVTVHRAENVDRKERLASIVKGLSLVKEHFSEYEMIFPIHPRTVKMLKEFGLTIDSSIRTIPPVGYFDMLSLQKNARLIITDSGGIQEEACLFKVPVVTIRDTTERPETVTLGVNKLVPGMDPMHLLEVTKEMFGKRHIWSNPFGDGKTAKRVVDILTLHLKTATR